MKRPGNEPIQPVDNGRRRRFEWHKVNNVLEEWFWLGLFHGEIKGVVYGVSVSSKEGLNTCEGKKIVLERKFVSEKNNSHKTRSLGNLKEF